MGNDPAAGDTLDRRFCGSMAKDFMERPRLEVSMDDIEGV
jgi:hypothetical protein